MDLPAEVLIHNQLLGAKGSRGTLLAVSPHGFYEVKLTFGKSTHRVLLPIPETAVIFRQPEAEYAAVEIER
jgi:hypothetical protein